MQLLQRASCDRIEPAALRCGVAIRLPSLKLRQARGIQGGPKLRSSVGRQEPREERIGNTVERGDTAGARRHATRRAGEFCVLGASKGSPVVPLRASPVHTLPL